MALTPGPARFFEPNREPARAAIPRASILVEDGTPPDPSTLRAAVPNWRPGDTIQLGRDRMLRVVATRLDEGSDGDPVSVLVLEPWPDRGLDTTVGPS
jgi:hypothetical protein